MKKPCYKKIIILFLIHSFCINAAAQKIKNTNTIYVDSGWANNSVNTVVFRKNSLYTYQNTQYISFYNKDAFVV